MQMGMPIQPMAPAKKSGGKGCLWAFLIVAVLSILLLVGGVFAANKWFSDTVGGVGCPAVSDADIEAVFENKVNVINTGSALTGVNLTLDDRIMAGEKGCNISVLGTAVAPKPGLGGIFKVEKADATGFFQKELANAKAGTPSANTGAQKPGSPVTIFGDTPLTEPGGAPVTIPNIPSGFAEGPYFLKDVKLGDEAFCTKANIFDASGVLVRKGNTIVYVTVTAGTKNDFDKDYSESNCEYAMKLATKALG